MFSQEIKEKLQLFWDKIQKIGFQFIIFALFGVYIGFNLATHIFDQKIEEAIKLQGVIHKGIPYDVKLRP